MHPKDRYLQHTDIFGLNKTSFGKIFEAYITKHENAYLDCSLKITHKVIFARRFHMFFNNDLKNRTSDFTHLLKAYLQIPVIKYNENIWSNFLKENADFLENITSIAIGVDERREPENTRLKIWFGIGEKNYKLANFFLLHSGVPISLLDPFIIGNTMLGGIDFYGDGRVRYKIYPCFKKYIFSNTIIYPKLQSCIPKKLSSFFSYIVQLNITFSEKNERIFHLGLEYKNIKYFDTLWNDRISVLISLIPVSELVFFAIPESECSLIQISSINIYYM